MSGFVPDPLHECLPLLGEELSHPEHPQDPGDTHISGIQQVVITSILAADLTLGLRRIPAGFYVTVEADGTKWQTSNKPVHVDQVVVEWNENMLLPSEPSSKVRVVVYASFELSPMLGHGERLRGFEVSVGELVERSENSRPFDFQPKAGDVVSSCTSLFVTVEQRVSYEDDAPAFCPIAPSTSCDTPALRLMTDAGHCILARYKRTQDHRDLDRAIKHFERASDLCPVEHPYRPATLSNLATAKFVSCQVNGTYLDIPISLFQDALDMRPTGHPDRPLTQLHLAIALLSRFAKRGFQADADAAKELLNEVRNVSLADSHLSRVALLAIETSALVRSTDANTLRAEGPIASMLPWSPNELARRVELCLHTDDPHAMDEVISLHYDALGYYSTANDQRGQLLCNLGVMLATRFERRGNSQDLDEAIALEREALAFHPIGHTHRSMSLNDLANQLSARFEHRGNDHDLDESIVLSREALALRPVGHTDRSASLNNLANQLSTRFEHRGNDQDLDEAVVLSREALALHPVGHTHRSMSLYNLASHLSARFQYRGTAQDLNESLENLCCALTLLSQHDLHQSMVHQSLAVVYLLFHRSELHATGDSSDSMNAAMHHFKVAANLVSGGFLGRLRASLDWVRHADKHAHGTDLEAYATSMQLLDAHMSATASVSSRHHTMKNFPSTLAVDAASCALRRGDVCRAVELLEQGRTLIWTQMARFRTPLDNLQDHGAHAEALMKKFRDLSSILDRPPSNHSEGMSRVDIEAEATRYRRLLENWNTALDDIRKIEGFDRFLLAPLFSELQGAARNGTIIILIASKSSCNAIIVPHKESPVSVE